MSKEQNGCIFPRELKSSLRSEINRLKSEWHDKYPSPVQLNV
jgi:hypothetical protein